MTTNRTFTLWLALALTLLGLGCVTGRSHLRGGLPPEQVAAFPAPVKEAYGLFTVRCSRCHTLSRPLNAAIYDFSHWQNYVARMRRQSGSGISKADAEKILVFLHYYSKQQLAETRTSTSGAAQ